jgi:drug/metabolite transporter (DMT)-like permease
MLAIWSANFIFVKFAVREIPALLAGCLRMVVAGAAMVPLYLLLRGRPEPGIRPWRLGDVPKLLLVGALGMIGNQVFFVVGLGRTSVAHAAVVTALAPVFVLLLATAAGIEHLTPRKICGMAVAATGVAVLQWGRAATGGATLAGDLILIGSTLVLASFTVFAKRLAATFGSVTLNLFSFAGAALLVLPFTAWDMARSDLAHVSALAWFGVFYMALFSSIAGYTIYSYALRHLAPSRVSSVTYFQPLIATLLAAVFLREKPGPAFAVAIVLVLGGVYLAERR